jgi:plasmid stabilization system protein ParE
MNRRIVLGRRALEDLRELGAWIAARTNDEVAQRYLNRLYGGRDVEAAFEEDSGED